MGNFMFNWTVKNISLAVANLSDQLLSPQFITEFSLDNLKVIFYLLLLFLLLQDS